MIAFLLLPLICRSDFSENSANYKNQESGSARDDDMKVMGIIEKLNQGDECFRDLGLRVKDLCENLDTKKRKELAMSLMICEQNADGRADRLPKTREVDQFVTSLTNEAFRIYTTFFISIDDICFQALQDQAAEQNYGRVMQLLKHVNISTQYVRSLTDGFQKKNQEITNKLGVLSTEINESSSQLNESYYLLFEIFGTLGNITKQADYFRGSISNIKFYLAGLAIGFIISIPMPEIFVPALIITGMFLYIEFNFSNRITFGRAYKWTYIACLSIVLLTALFKYYNRVYKKIYGEQKGNKKNPDVPKFE